MNFKSQILLLTVLPGTLALAAGSRSNATTTGTRWLSHYANLAVALSSTSKHAAKLNIDTTPVLTTDVEIPPNVTLNFVGGHQLICDGNAAITIRGLLKADNYQIFANTCTVKFSQDAKPQTVAAQWFGAKGDGTSDDSVPIQRACDALYFARAGTLFFPPGNYALNSAPVYCYGAISVKGVPGKSIITGRTGVSNSGRQITISSCLSSSRTPLCPNASKVLDRTAVGALAAGHISLTLSDVTGLSKGQTVYMWLGADPTDHTLPHLTMFNLVTSISGNTVTFSEPIPENVPDPSELALRHHVWLPQGIAENVELSGLTFARDRASGNHGYLASSVQYGRNVHIHDLTAEDTGFGALGVNYGSNYIIESIACNHMMYEPTVSTASGGCISGWSMNNIRIRNLKASDVNGVSISFEGQNRDITIADSQFSETQAAVSFPVFVALVGNSLRTSVDNCSFNATGRLFDSISSTHGAARISNISLYNLASTNIVNAAGPVSYNGARGDNVQHWSRAFPLIPNMTQVDIGLPQGWYTQIKVFVTTTTGITRFALVTNHGGSDYLASLAPGNTVDIGAHSAIPFLGPMGAITFNNNYDSNPPYAKFTQVSTDGSVPEGAWGRIEVDYLQVTPANETTQGPHQ